MPEVLALQEMSREQASPDVMDESTTSLCECDNMSALSYICC